MPEPAEGQVPAGKFVPKPEKTPKVVEKPKDVDKSSDSTKTVNEIAQEVISGYWGRGNACKKRLQDAGYDVADVSEEVKRIFNTK